MPSSGSLLVEGTVVHADQAPYLREFVPSLEVAAAEAAATFGLLVRPLKVEETEEAEFKSVADPEESAEETVEISSDPYGGIGKPL